MMNSISAFSYIGLGHLDLGQRRESHSAPDMLMIRAHVLTRPTCSTYLRLIAYHSVLRTHIESCVLLLTQSWYAQVHQSAAHSIH